MAKQFSAISDRHRDFIAAQKIFFTGSCAAGARVNISPRSTTHLHVLGPNAVAYLDLTGSGSETAAHVKAEGALTVMLCAFDGPPSILRLYGKGRIAFRGTPDYVAVLDRFYGSAEPAGARQIVFLAVDLVQTSCGYAVPLFDHVGERPILDRWAQAQGEEGLRAYRAEKNAASIDGLPTGFRDP
ncbi:pyridoxamine 5'-phosphate oxidase family protein [Methylobacterium sp. J-090]|uniref:pyridoxamine 5'-phosphate oxidase family protein n=1 Tax=Methylobacterium sp. J-090 TaxID=2836666 RepID=UPI001FB9A825|nr:pyridoxamine 5'-phosphate oxidase family protein [Methylobacterium sp. J-090]MCJ2083593.1 pyridoxamine 5'-phosphate oxidase family protein [Methylobacterium sp. J-090]